MIALNNHIIFHLKVYKRERYELTGKWDTTIGAPDDFDLFLGFSEESALMASSETCDNEEGTKHLKKAEKRAIAFP